MPVTINGTTGIAGANGSASTPAVQGEDTNTGVFFPAADTVAVATGGFERMRVTSTGNVGIGTDTPIAKLTVVMDTASVSFGNLSTDVAQIGVSSVADSMAFGLFTGGGAAFTERARIDSNGVLTVGQTSNIDVFSGSADGCSIEGDGAISLSRSANASLFIRRRTSNGAVAAFLRDTTQVGRIDVTTTATSYVTSSDYRLKENVQPMQDALAKIAQLNPVTYTWKADGSDGQGFIAHELQAVVPDCVTGEKDAVDAEGNPQYQGVDTSFLVATLVKAVQELTARIAALEAAQ